MFVFIRLAISCLFFLCSFIAIKKVRKINKRKLYTFFITIAIVLYFLLSFIPFENLFLTFDSPESAYRYFIPGKSDIELVVDGNNCDLVVDCKNDTSTLLIIPKTENGWKIGTGSNMVRVVQKLSDGISVNIYQYKNSNDYFITVLNVNGGELKISDDYNTVFYSTEKNNTHLEKSYVTYYAHLADFTAKYCIEVNGELITFN